MTVSQVAALLFVPIAGIVVTGCVLWLTRHDREERHHPAE